ncbi:MAG TPA: FAD-binding oxidoreductase [Candidatus Acidoferrales bacterium]|nr:FAD-binding oxidoreductase [Candidatus Acidoferrales bacterium]
MSPSSSSAGADATALEVAWDELRGIVGPERLRPASPADAVCSVEPRMVVEPGDEKELAGALRWANDSGIAVAPRGGGTKLAWGNRPTRLDLILSTARLNHIVEHAWADMTLVVEAGTTVAQLQQALAQHGQRLATDPLWPERATVGGILSTNDSGTLRVRFGGLRDLIIGVTLALPDGTLAKSGGKVVKNVAGYDLPKLATGALGTLGVITRAAFRLHPLPPTEGRTLTFRAGSVSDANRLIVELQGSALAHTGLQARMCQDAQPEVDVRFDGTAAGIEAQCATARKLAAFAMETGKPAEAWNARQELWAQAGAAVVAKFSVLPSRIAGACETVRRAAEKGRMKWKVVAQGTGLGWVRLEAPRPVEICEALATVRAEFERETGSLFVAHRPDGAGAIDAWGSPGDAFPVMVRVKQQFDPRGTLNPGRFVGGI